MWSSKAYHHQYIAGVISTSYWGTNARKDKSTWLKTRRDGKSSWRKPFGWMLKMILALFPTLLDRFLSKFEFYLDNFQKEKKWKILRRKIKWKEIIINESNCNSPDSQSQVRRKVLAAESIIVIVTELKKIDIQWI